MDETVDVDDWLFDFLERHRKRYRPFDWPEPGSDEDLLFAEVWSHAFRRDGVAEREADDASIALGPTPPRYRSDHLPAILRAVRQGREERATRIRVYSPPPSPEPAAWPDGVPAGDMMALWRHMAEKHGAPNIRRAR